MPDLAREEGRGEILNITAGGIQTGRPFHDFPGLTPEESEYYDERRKTASRCVELLRKGNQQEVIALMKSSDGLIPPWAVVRIREALHDLEGRERGEEIFAALEKSRREEGGWERLRLLDSWKYVMAIHEAIPGVAEWVLPAESCIPLESIRVCLTGSLAKGYRINGEKTMLESPIDEPDMDLVVSLPGDEGELYRRFGLSLSSVVWEATGREIFGIGQTSKATPAQFLGFLANDEYIRVPQQRIFIIGADIIEEREIAGPMSLRNEG